MSTHKVPEPSKYTDQLVGLKEISENCAPIASSDHGSGGKLKPHSKPNTTLAADLVHRIAESLKDVGSDEEDDLDDDLENDKDLLDELQHITDGDFGKEPLEDFFATVATTTESGSGMQSFLPTTATDTINIIQQRIQMYNQARACAKTSGESAKARRFGRGLKTLLDLLKQVKAGKTINADDIPPRVSTKPLARSATKEGSSSVSDESLKVQGEKTTTSVETPMVAVAEEIAKQADPLIDQLRSRQRDYKTAALQSERNGDTNTSLQFLKVVEQFDLVIKMCENGQEVDLSDMPPLPEQFVEFLAKMQGGDETTD